jgi:hypothetical protein
MTAEFSLFKRLPCEIRQAIWSLAINKDLDEDLPEKPGVHFFKVDLVDSGRILRFLQYPINEPNSFLETPCCGASWRMPRAERQPVATQ